MIKLPYDRIAEAVLKIKLDNGYDIITTRKRAKDNEHYTITLYVKNKSIDLLDQGINTRITVPAENRSEKDINVATVSAVARMYENGELNYYFERYEYYMRTMVYGEAALSGESD